MKKISFDVQFSLTIILLGIVSFCVSYMSLPYVLDFYESYSSSKPDRSKADSALELKQFYSRTSVSLAITNNKIQFLAGQQKDNCLLRHIVYSNKKEVFCIELNNRIAMLSNKRDILIGELKDCEYEISKYESVNHYEALSK